MLAALPPSYEARRALADARKQLGVVDHAAGEPAEGLKKTQDAVPLYQALLREKPGDQDVRFQLALATVNLGNFAMEQDPDVAIARYREALALLAPLRREAPSNPRYAEWEARTKSNLGLILAGDQEDRGGHRISARGGRRGRAGLRRFPPARCPGDLPQ